MPCFLPVLGGAGGGAGPLPPSSLSGGGGAEAAMDWGTRVSVGGGWRRPQAAPSPRRESGAAQPPPEQQQALVTPRGKAQSWSTNCAPAPDSPPARSHSNRNRNSNGLPPPSTVRRESWEGTRRRTQEGWASSRHSSEVPLIATLAGCSCVRRTTQQGQRKLRVGLGAARTRPFPL